jgi:hypothetical protein
LNPFHCCNRRGAKDTKLAQAGRFSQRGICIFPSQRPNRSRLSRRPLQRLALGSDVDPTYRPPKPLQPPRHGAERKQREHCDDEMASNRLTGSSSSDLGIGSPSLGIGMSTGVGSGLGDQFRAMRKSKSVRTLNDAVEEIHLTLFNDEKYHAYHDAVYDEQAVEGSLSADNLMAAQLIRNYAMSKGRTEVAKEKLATISKALGVVLNRYNLGRRSRRNMLGGEIVPDANGNGE